MTKVQNLIAHDVIILPSGRRGVIERVEKFPHSEVEIWYTIAGGYGHSTVKWDQEITVINPD